MTDNYEGDKSGRQKGRSLGYNETSCYMMKTSSSMVSVMFVRTMEEVTIEHITTTWKILTQNNEALQMGIIEQSSGDESGKELHLQPFRSPGAIQVEEITVRNKDDWTDIMMQYKDKPWDYVNGPLWRFVLARMESHESEESKNANIRKEDNNATQTETGKSGHDKFRHEYMFFFQISHLISDGVSFIDLTEQQFIPILSALAKGEHAEKMIPFIPLTNPAYHYLLEPEKLENLLPWYQKILIDAYRWINRTFRAKDETPLYMFGDEALPTVGDPGWKPLYMGTSFSRELSESVIRAAKRHRVSLHSVLLFANSVAFSRTALAAGVTLPRTFKQAWPVNLRKYTNFRTPQPLALMVGGGMTDHTLITDCTLMEFWN